MKIRCNGCGHEQIVEDKIGVWDEFFQWTICEKCGESGFIGKRNQFERVV